MNPGAPLSATTESTLTETADEIAEKTELAEAGLVTDPVDITVQIRVDRHHPAFSEDFFHAEVNIGGHTFTADRITPM